MSLHPEHMSLHPELYPSDQARVFDQADTSFQKMVYDAYDHKTPVEKDLVLSSFAQLYLKGAEAVGADNALNLRYNLDPVRFSVLAYRALTGIVTLNERGLIQPPFEHAELEILEKFTAQTNPSNRA